MQNQGDLDIDTGQFDTMERDFQEVLRDLGTDQNLERFRSEFDKLYRSLKIIHENQRRLISKCREYNAEISQNASKIQTVLKMTADDSAAIQQLKTQLEKAYKVLEIQQEREEKHKQKIKIQENEIKQLNQTIEQSKALNSGQTTTVHELLQRKQELLKEKEILVIQVTGTRSENQSIQDRIKLLEASKESVSKEYKELQTKKAEFEERLQKDEDAKNITQAELEKIKKDFDSLKEDEKQLGNERKKIKSEIEKVTLQNSVKTKEIENFKQEKNRVDKELRDTKEKLDSVEKINEQIEEKIKDTRLQIELFETEIAQLHQKINEGEEKKKRMTELVKEQEELAKKIEEEKQLANNGLNQLEDDIQLERRQASEDRQIIEDLRRARNILQKEIDRCDNNNKKIEEDFIAKQKYLSEKQNELGGLQKKIDYLNKKIANVEKETEQQCLQFSQAQTKYFHSLDEIKLKDSLISEFQKKNIETEAKLKQQQNLYETVRSDRNLYSKNYTEKQQEIEKMRRSYKIVNHQISQLKEEIEAKGNALAKEHLEHKKKDKTIEEQSRVLEKYKTDIDEKAEKINKYIKRVDKLQFTIKDEEQQIQNLKEEFELVVAERDILSTQLIRRISETNLLYEKIKINESTLKKGEQQYRERLGDIQMLKEKIADYKREIKVFKREADTIKDLEGDIHNLTKELTEEKLKAKALTEELENPMNVHRWRKLEATDSENYELMTKIHSLQKRLIQKTEEVLIKEKVVEEKEKELKALKDEMKRKPGLEDQAMIPYYQDSLRQKEEQMKAMDQELSMYQSHINEYKLEIDRINKELQRVKQKYFNQKKREQQQRDLRIQEEQGQSIQVILPEKKFVGGGFALQK
ncbi:unnamed protein product [Paramecium sonneborni]|uniref:Cilia- and flagella-associated protein 58 central coiled coil domain-containing protein n=1 Tax=Paramecium sonneborni TaxID=65129 RepID=A0A8S1PWG7_9CILI|nr:unnamed protein product [Paramecium sonneborni]